MEAGAFISVAEQAMAEATYEPPRSYLRDVRGVPAPTPEATATSEPEVRVQDARVGQLQAFFGSRPLGAYAAAMIAASDAYGIDWRLMPVISILESSGGLHACGGNAWGYAACRVRFASFDEGIQVVAAALARGPYAGHSTAAVLCIWVSGNACTNEHGVNYAYRAFSLYAVLGGWFALPPRPTTQPVSIVEAPSPSPSATPTPEATAEPEPSATSEPTPEPEPTATPTPEATATPQATTTAETSTTPEADSTVAAMEGQPEP